MNAWKFAGIFLHAFCSIFLPTGKFLKKLNYTLFSQYLIIFSYTIICRIYSMATRSSGPVLNPDLTFPECARLSTQLPDAETVVGLTKFYLREGQGVASEKAVLREVSKLLYTKWMHDTVYCISLPSIVKKVTKLWHEYKEGVRRLREGRENSAAVL